MLIINDKKMSSVKRFYRPSALTAKIIQNFIIATGKRILQNISISTFTGLELHFKSNINFLGLQGRLHEKETRHGNETRKHFVKHEKDANPTPPPPIQKGELILLYMLMLLKIKTFGNIGRFRPTSGEEFDRNCEKAHHTKTFHLGL